MKTILQSGSLKRRMLLIALCSTLLAWVVGAAAMYWSAIGQNDQLHDERLAELAHTLLRFADHELLELRGDGVIGPGGIVDEETTTALQGRYRYQIWSNEGQILLRSANASPDQPLGQQGKHGFDHVQIDGRETCVYVHQANSGQMAIHVAEFEDERASVLVGTLAGPVMSFFVAVLVLLSLIGWFLAKALQPAAEIARQLVLRGPTELTPLSMGGLPQELVPIHEAINALFGRIGAAMARERDFSSVAAHELRTPLAALRLHAQIAQRTTDPAVRAEALGGLQASVDRCAHFVDQLLTLARVEGQPVDARVEPIDLPQLVSDVIDDLAVEANRRKVQIISQVDDTAGLVGRRFGVQTMLRNLVSNAIRHVPPGGHISIASEVGEQGVSLIVDDSGCGIPAAERERVFDRFRRLHDDGTGIGLGLSIVRTVAEAHRAVVKLLDSPLGGLRVQIQFPLTKAEA
ncbi:MAG: sensor histidine kinase [Leptothrix sp. (in: b-proteobacteria)]